ncbi:MAG TPA: acyl-CoA dehydrogenase family protein [Burkholderiales bacterium]|nr:acyl-CoA dehydrogenase family protein [Burkholderiales bacterium]
MNFELTPEQTAMRDAVRRMVERELVPVVSRFDDRETLPKEAYLEVLGALAQQRLTAPRLPAEAGGAGLTMLDYGILFEQIPPTIGMNLMSHEGCVTRLHLECSVPQKERLLPDLIAGRKVGCTGSTEPDTGSDPRGIRTRLVTDGGALRLYGSKMWITHASVCDVMIVTCLDAREGRGGREVIKVVVEKARSPFVAREIETIGLTQGYLGEAVFDGCIVPDENLIESARGGTSVLRETWNVNRPLVGLQAVHLAQAAFDIALEYAKLRKAFGKAIAGHQLIQKNFSDMATSIEASRLLCYRALALVDQGSPAEGSSAMAKRYAQNACERVVWEAMNVLGALGLARETRLERMYRDARMLSIPDGTNELLALMHARELTGIAAFRDARPS